MASPWLCQLLTVFFYMLMPCSMFAQHEVTAQENAKYTSHIVTVSGDVEHPFSFTVDTLINWGLKHGDSFISGNGDSTHSTYDYVSLKDVLSHAILKQKNKKDRAFYIVGRGSDGYKVVFSWAEVFADEFVQVLVKENDSLIKVKGDMILTNMYRPHSGGQHVYWLSRIEVHHVD